MITEEDIHRYHITERVFGLPLPVLGGYEVLSGNGTSSKKIRDNGNLLDSIICGTGLTNRNTDSPINLTALVPTAFIKELGDSTGQ
jgi:hypothetical protein